MCLEFLKLYLSELLIINYIEENKNTSISENYLVLYQKKIDIEPVCVRKLVEKYREKNKKTVY
jgi:hypothetical protein